MIPLLRSPWTWLSLAVLAVLLVFLVWPVLNILSASVLARNDEGLSGWQVMLSDPRYPRAIGNTLLLGLGVTLLAACIGVPLAYLTARHRYPGKALVSILPLITLIIPEVIGAQTWLMILGNNGVLTRALRDGLELDPPSFYGWPGLLTVMTFTYYAYIYIGTLAAIRGFDAQLEEAAQSLGTSPPLSRLKVMAPVVMPAVLASALLVFTMVVGNFATSMILGHRVELLSVLTYQASVSETGSDPVMQSTLATTSISLVMLALFLQRWIVSRGRYEITQGRAVPETPIRGPGGLAMAVSALAVMVLSMLPLGTLAVGAFTRAHGPVMRWGEWTVGHLERVLINAPGPVLNSVMLAGAATLIAIAFSTLASYLIVKKRNALTPWLDYLSSIPLALSGTVIGIGLLMTFGHGAFDLSGTASLIVLAYIVRRLPFGVRNASSTLFNLPDSIEEASISLGVPPLASFLKVVLPLMAPAIAAAAVLTWTTTVSELSASVIVYSPGHETLPIQIFRLIDSGLMAQASAYGLVLITVILAPVLLATRVFNIRLFA
ncbi:ABC transporter permease [Achromobacter piechaudii]|uniref:ABC transporter, permease protein n=1 Tax=Achromobacter piechaudii ATCC 43553 TaxID=742159 RepID=D4X9F7_9BURK|nr:iron ABC transporter permease [Achromobacter piechaudii]EFF76418.1 ABC transporter, permease protein [Achromobacter piechaudii ATCC 43553]